MSTVAQQSYLPALVPLEAAVPASILETVLTPYKKHCRYLQSVPAEKDSSGTALLNGRGTFSIPESCYIADTGPFNAVEFNICYNQLTYSLLAQAIDRKS